MHIETYIDSITIPVTTIDPTDITIIIGIGNILLILYNNIMFLLYRLIIMKTSCKW